MADEYLYVNGRDVTYQEWSRYGTTPYLDAVEGSNIISTATNNKKEGCFTFADTVNTPTACTIDLYAKGAYDEDLGYGAVKIYLYDGSTWTYIATVTLTQSTYKWYSVNCFTILGTQAKVNAAQMYLVSTVAGVQDVFVDCARLKVTYGVAAPKMVGDGLTWVVAYLRLPKFLLGKKGVKTS